MVVHTNFPALMKKVRGDEFTPPERLLCLDPGETTGWALFVHGHLEDMGQLKTIGDWAVIDGLFAHTEPTHVVFENYRVYAHKLERHSNSEVFTLRLVGVIEYLCDIVYRVPRGDQMAHQAKGFVSDEKLKAWGYYSKGHRHARDAVRHGVYYLLFNKTL